MNKFLKMSLCFSIILQSCLYASAQMEEMYKQAKLLTRVLTLVEDNYIEDVKSQELIDASIKGMLKILDPYTQFLDPVKYKKIKQQTQGSFSGIGVHITLKNKEIIIITPLVDTPAYKAGILPEDKIIKINGEPTTNFSITDVSNKLRGDVGTVVKITVKRKDEELLEFELTREMIKISKISHKLLQDNIGYIRIAEFNANTKKDFDKALTELLDKNIKSLVLDIRNNPGGIFLAAIDVLKSFIGDRKLLVYTKGRSGENIVEYKAEDEPGFGYMPLVVLVNNGSASCSEIVAGAIKDWNRGIIIGTRTFGKASVQTLFDLPKGKGLKLTTGRYYTPSGKSIDDKGVEPEIVLDKNIGFKLKNQTEKQEDIDPQIEYACSILNIKDLFTEAEAAFSKPKILKE